MLTLFNNPNLQISKCLLFLPLVQYDARNWLAECGNCELLCESQRIVDGNVALATRRRVDQGALVYFHGKCTSACNENRETFIKTESVHTVWIVGCWQDGEHIQAAGIVEVNLVLADDRKSGITQLPLLHISTRLATYLFLLTLMARMGCAKVSSNTTALVFVL